MLHDAGYRKIRDANNQRYWEQDICRYEMLKEWRTRASKHCIEYIDRMMKMIRDKYPNVKNW